MGAIPPEWPGFIGDARNIRKDIWSGHTDIGWSLRMAGSRFGLFGMSPKQRSQKRRMENKIAELLRLCAQQKEKLEHHDERAQEVLRQAMFDYGSHRQTCAIFDPEQEDAICDCGYDDLTAGLFEKYKEEEEVQIQDAENPVNEARFERGARVEEIRDSASGQLLRATEIPEPSPERYRENAPGRRQTGRVEPTRPWPDPPEREEEETPEA